MGLFVHLYIKPDGILPETWESVYQESLVLLRKFPAPLMRVMHEKIGSKTRIVFTSDIVCEANTQSEHWVVIGDMSSYQRAESFCLYKHLEEQFSECSKEERNKHDVLWAMPEDLDYVDGNGIDLFGDKTQGYPYHLAILAVAILFEIRFPDQCYLMGDVDRVQADQMSRWIHSILDTPVIMPVCFDGERLFKRLCVIFADQRHAIKRFETLFLGSNEEQFGTLIRFADKTALLESFVDNLSHYSSLSQLGASKLISQFIVVTKDLRLLIDVVLRAEKTKKKKSDEFNLASLLSMLCDGYLTIPFEEREALGFFTRSENDLRTIEDAFSDVFMLLGGAPSSVELYLESTETLDIFCEYRPEQRSVFQEIIRTCEQRCRKELEKIRTIINDIEQKVQKKAEEHKVDSGVQAVEIIPHADDVMSMNLSEEESYILKQITLQKKRFKNVESSASIIGTQLRKMISKYPDMFCSEDRAHFLEKIYAASHDNGIALRESAWQAIDKELNLDILKHLFALASVEDDEINFWHIRIHIFENRFLWKYLIGESQSITV